MFWDTFVVLLPETDLLASLVAKICRGSPIFWGCFPRLKCDFLLVATSSVIWRVNGTCVRIVDSGVARNLIWGGVYVLTSHCNFKTCVNVPHVNKTVTDLGVYIYRYTPRRYAHDRWRAYRDFQSIMLQHLYGPPPQRCLCDRPSIALQY